MKILLINDNGSQTGGAEKYIINLKTFLKNKHDVRLFSANSINSYSDFSFNKSTNKFRIYSDQIFNFDSFKEMKKTLKIFNPDVVHIHNIDKAISASILSLFKNIPIVMTIHDYDLVYPGFEYLRAHDCKMPSGKYCNKCTTRKSYILFKLKNRIRVPIIKKNIDLFIASSTYILKIIREGLEIKNIIHINYGIKLYKYVPLINTNQLLFVGRLEKTKGIYSLIYAYDKICKQYPNIKLVIAGDGKEKYNLIALVKKLKLKNIKFTGWLKDEEIGSFYKFSSILIIPSIWEEPFGLVGIEAMSVGRPVIASRVGGIPEWLDDGKTGYLVDPGNSEQIAERVIQLLSDKKLLEQMGKNARKKAEQFSIKKNAEEIEKTYLELISKEYKTKETF